MGDVLPWLLGVGTVAFGWALSELGAWFRTRRQERATAQAEERERYLATVRAALSVEREAGSMIQMIVVIARRGGLADNEDFVLVSRNFNGAHAELRFRVEEARVHGAPAMAVALDKLNAQLDELAQEVMRAQIDRMAAGADYDVLMSRYEAVTGAVQTVVASRPAGAHEPQE